METMKTAKRKNRSAVLAGETLQVVVPHELAVRLREKANGEGLGISAWLRCRIIEIEKTGRI